jgi:hypothetical protein
MVVRCNTPETDNGAAAEARRLMAVAGIACMIFL